MDLDKIRKLFQTREFISVATCDFNGRPNVAPKLLLKFEDGFVYLVDYVLGTTFKNLQNNPRASISSMDLDSLTGYQLNGPVEMLESGAEYNKILQELVDKEIDLSTRRIIEGVEKGKVHAGFEVSMSQNFVVLKLKIEEVVEIGSTGTLKRHKI